MDQPASSDASSVHTGGPVEPVMYRPAEGRRVPWESRLSDHKSRSISDHPDAWIVVAERKRPNGTRLSLRRPFEDLPLPARWWAPLDFSPWPDQLVFIKDGKLTYFDPRKMGVISVPVVRWRLGRRPPPLEMPHSPPDIDDELIEAEPGAGGDALEQDPRTMWAARQYAHVKGFSQITKWSARFILGELDEFEHAEAIVRARWIRGGSLASRPAGLTERPTLLAVRTLTRWIFLNESARTTSTWMDPRPRGTAIRRDAIAFATDENSVAIFHGANNDLKEAVLNGAGGVIRRLPSLPGTLPVPELTGSSGIDAPRDSIVSVAHFEESRSGPDEGLKKSVAIAYRDEVLQRLARLMVRDPKVVHGSWWPLSIPKHRIERANTYLHAVRSHARSESMTDLHEYVLYYHHLELSAATWARELGFQWPDGVPTSPSVRTEGDALTDYY